MQTAPRSLASAPCVSRADARRASVVACSSRVDRRAALAGVLAAGSLLTGTGRAWALLPDDDDEELLRRTMANRKERMAAERVRERKFMESEGLVNNRLAAKIGPAQEAVNRMVKAGASLSKDDAAGTVAALDGVKGKIGDALGRLSTTDEAKELVGTVAEGVGAISAAASKGDLSSAKAAYIIAVDSLTQWAAAAGVRETLKSL